MLPAVVHALHVACNPCCAVEICGFNPQCMLNTAWVIPPVLKAELTPLHLSSHSPPGVQIVECSAKKGEGKNKVVEKEKARETGEESSFALTPYPTPLLYFSGHISLRQTHDLNAWSRLVWYTIFPFTSLGSNVKFALTAVTEGYLSGVNPAHTAVATGSNSSLQASR